MRWIVTLLTASCLLAASAARPARACGHDLGAPKLAPASASLVACTAPRRLAVGPEVRLSPVALVAAGSFDAPPRSWMASASDVVADVAEPARPVVASRGPPRG